MTYSMSRIVSSGCLFALVLTCALSAQASSSRDKADAEQLRLDTSCQQAREAILSVERAQYIEECVQKKFPRSDRQGCEKFYADHGNAAGGRAPLYMDLPECVEAHEFRQNRSR